MKLPSNMSEADVLKVIDKIARRLAKGFKFGFHDVADIEQEARVMGLKALEKYDPEKGALENFLSRDLKRKLINFKRDNFKRSDAPCLLCKNAIDGHTKHPDGQFCEKYIAWDKWNQRKQNVITPLDISNISDENESNTRMESSVLEDIEHRELLSLIDQQLPVELRATYLQMRDGYSVPKPKRLEVERAVLNIIKGEECQTNEEL